MGHSQRLLDRDIRSVIRLVCECCELGEDPQGWRAHMLTQLQPTLGASMGSAYVGRLPFDPASAGFAPNVEVGGDERYARYASEGDVRDNPMTPYIVSRLHIGFTSTRQQMCSDRAWYASSTFNEVWRPMRTDHTFVSIIGLPGQRCFSGIGLGRCLGDKPFGERERQLLDLLRTSLAEIWQAVPRDDIATSLSRRLRQVLSLLRRGLSEKEVAVGLGLSKHTVHDYVKALHRRFQVTSRFELMRVEAARPSFRPRLV